MNCAVWGWSMHLLNPSHERPDPITLLGRLLSDPQSCPLPDDGDVPGIGRLDHHQLERQSRGLVSKRWHEVRSLIPMTARMLGCDGYRRFAAFARSHWPVGAKRHVADALMFLRWLARDKQAINTCELRAMRVMAGERRVAIGWDRTAAAIHICWHGAASAVQQRWLRWGLWYPRSHASGGAPHVSLSDPRRSRTASV